MSAINEYWVYKLDKFFGVYKKISDTHVELVYVRDPTSPAETPGSLPSLKFFMTPEKYLKHHTEATAYILKCTKEELMEKFFIDML